MLSRHSWLNKLFDAIMYIAFMLLLLATMIVF